MKKNFINVIGLCLAGIIGLTGCFGGETKSAPETSTEEIKGDEKNSKEDNSATQIITIGAHFNQNPDLKDPVTGDYMMSDENQRAIVKTAMQKVKDELKVDIEFAMYSGDTTEALLQSVLAGDPVADIVYLYANSQGIILGQNVLQPLDDYLDNFTNSENIPAQIYGKNYFLYVDGNYNHPLSPLFYNINYIEQVDALKVDGVTQYPTDIYKEGNWTWSVFKDYLAKIDAHYSNIQAPVRPENRIEAYKTSYTETLLQAMHSSGGSIYGAEGIGIESEATKNSVKFVKELIDTGLLTTEVREGTSANPYNFQGEPFELGESVFTNMEDWRLRGATKSASERGESIGFIPFPRPDDMKFDDPNYRQVRIGGDTYAILKGIDEAKIPLTIKTFEMFEAEKQRLSEELAGREEGQRDYWLLGDIDTYHEKIGTDMHDIYMESVGKTVVNELSNMTNVYWDFMEIAGDSIFGVDGSPAYDVAIESKKHIITDKIASIEAVLAGTEARDNIVPEFKAVTEGEVYSFAKGTNPSTINWNDKFTVKDNLDDKLDASTVEYDQTLVDYNTVGIYKNGVIGEISDSSGNVGKKRIDVIVFDGENTTPPTITIKEEYRDIIVGEDTSTINWANDFIETAIDKDGIDIRAKIIATLDTLDTSTEGTYNVKITATDYANNSVETLIEVNVVTPVAE